MTNLEYIRTCTKEELAKLLCMGLVSEDFIIGYCSNCVASKYCYWGHIGFTDWLDAERSEGK